MNAFCEAARDAGVSVPLHEPVKPSKEEYEKFKSVSPFAFQFKAINAPLMLPTVSPWDSDFATVASNSDTSFVSVSPWNPKFPLVEEDFISYSPFDSRFPVVVMKEYIWTNDLGMIRSNPRKNHHSMHSRVRSRKTHTARKLRTILRKAKEFRREAGVKRRQAKRAFKRIPEGLRFPTSSHNLPFTSVSPFDERFPRLTVYRKVKEVKVVRVAKSPKASRSPVWNLPRRSFTKTTFLPASAPFPALSPIAAAMRARQAPEFFWDLQSHQQVYTVYNKFGILR